MPQPFFDLPAAKEQLEAAKPFQNKPFAFGKRFFPYYIKNIPDHFVRSIDPRPALRTPRQKLLNTFRTEFKKGVASFNGLWNLVSDLALTTVPKAFKDFKQAENPIQGAGAALKTLTQGTVLAAGGLGAMTAYLALFPAMGIPGLLLSNVFYEAGKRLTSQITGIPRQSTPVPGQTPSSNTASGDTFTPTPLAPPAAENSPVSTTATPPTASPVPESAGSGVATPLATADPATLDPKTAFHQLPAHSQKTLTQALASQGLSVNDLLKDTP
jgi:hypothetical protein